MNLFRYWKFALPQRVTFFLFTPFVLPFALRLALRDRYTIVLVTHNMQQAARTSDYTGFFLKGELMEFGATEKVFTTPENKATEDYIRGRFG